MGNTATLDQEGRTEAGYTCPQSRGHQRTKVSLSQQTWGDDTSQGQPSGCLHSSRRGKNGKVAVGPQEKAASHSLKASHPLPQPEK